MKFRICNVVDMLPQDVNLINNDYFNTITIASTDSQIEINERIKKFNSSPDVRPIYLVIRNSEINGEPKCIIHLVNNDDPILVDAWDSLTIREPEDNSVVVAKECLSSFLTHLEGIYYNIESQL